MLNNPEGQPSEINQYKDRITKFSAEFELGLFLLIARKNFLWILLFIFLAGVSAFVYLRYSQPVYRSSTTIQLVNDNDAQKILEVNNANENQNQLAEALELLRSPAFLKRVLDKLNLKNGYFNEGTFRSNEMYSNSPFFVVANIKNAALFNNKIYVEFDNKLDGKISYTLSKRKTELFFKNETWAKNADLEIMIFNNPKFQKENLASSIKSLEKAYFVPYNEDQMISMIQTKIDVKVVNDQARTIQVMIQDINAEKAADIANIMAEEFIVFERENKRASSQSVINFINDQLNTISDTLRSSETNLVGYTKKKNISSDQEIIKIKMGRLGPLEDQILRAQIDLIIVDSITQSLYRNKAIDSYQLLSVVSGSSEEAVIKEHINNLSKSLIQKEELLMTYKPNSPSIAEINNKIDIQRKFLLSSINTFQAKLKQKYITLKSKSREIESNLENSGSNDMDYLRMMRKFNINEKYYYLLLEKRIEFYIANAGFVSKNLLLEKAKPNLNPVSPSKKTTLILAVIATLAASLLLIFVKYIFHDKINSLNDIAKHTNAGVNNLGIIPKYTSKIPVSQLVIDKNPKSLISESFRTIRSNLQFLSSTEGPKLMAITSTISGEGKTFTAINLAGIIALTGKKVIIMDLDMRKPKIHKGFDAANEKGMSTILINRNSVQECIHKSNLENLHFITAGPIPPNPSELILSERMNQVIEELKKSYDLIIADNPPVGLVTDGISIIQKADYPIYVFRADYSRKNFIQIIDRLQNESQIKKLSVVLNGVDIQRNSYGYNYGYGYGYGYGGYGYGYYEDKTEKKKRFFGKG